MPPPLWPRLRELQGDLRDLDPWQDRYTNNDVPPTRETDHEQKDLIEEGLWGYGLETLAFYKSLHFQDDGPFPGKWGIFLFNYGIEHIAEEIELYHPGRWDEDQLRTKAVRFLHRHERFHFRFDAWAISHEAILDQPLYETYHRFYYQVLFPSEKVVEESLANKHTLLSLKGEEIGEFMRDFMDRQPAAYSQYGRDITELRATLAANLIDGPRIMLGAPTKRRYEQAPWIVHGRDYLLWDRNCPVYVIMGASPSDLIVPNLGAPSFREFHGFVFNYLSGNVASRTDHLYYIIDNGELIKMPNLHAKEDRLKPWEFKGNLLKSGMTLQEYRKERASTRVWKKNCPRIHHRTLFIWPAVQRSQRVFVDVGRSGNPKLRDQVEKDSSLFEIFYE